MADLPGKALARELIDGSEAESRATPMEDLIAAVRERGMDTDTANRLFGRLWTLERMFYYVYGGWGQGLEMNDFPPSIKYLFARQIVDESTHEMLYMDALLRQGCVATQKEAFRHPYGKFAVDSPTAYYVFSLRNLATYPHPIRIAALNLGPKIIELAWMEAFRDGAVPLGLPDRPPGLSPLPARGQRLRAAAPDAATAGRAGAGDRLREAHMSLKIDHERCTECRMCYIVCRELDINAVYVALDPLHRIEIDLDACTYPGCTACLMYCPAEGSIVEAATGRSLVPPHPEAWQEGLP